MGTLYGIAALKDGKKSVTSTEEMMRALERMNDMVRENEWKIYRESNNERIRKEMNDNPNAEPPVIMIAEDTLALYPFLEKHETPKPIRCFIEKCEVQYDDINISEVNED